MVTMQKYIYKDVVLGVALIMDMIYRVIFIFKLIVAGLSTVGMFRGLNMVVEVALFSVIHLIKQPKLQGRLVIASLHLIILPDLRHWMPCILIQDHKKYSIIFHIIMGIHQMLMALALAFLILTLQITMSY